MEDRLPSREDDIRKAIRICQTVTAVMAAFHPHEVRHVIRCQF
jgi:hypothetical protein